MLPSIFALFDFIPAEDVLQWLLDWNYIAMFSVLLLCGLGLPLPEEIPLIGSGVVVGFGGANFFLASLTCALAILIGDSFAFYAGRFVSSRWPDSWFVRFINNAKVKGFFAKHGWKAVFFARFFAGIRIGVYAYAGQHGMRWIRFILLDLCGVLISGPTSIWLGMYAVQRLDGDTPQEKFERARELFKSYEPWIIGALVVLILSIVIFAIYKTRSIRQAMSESPTAETDADAPEASPEH